MKNFYYVYVLKSIKYSNELYVGFTSNLEKRLEQHNGGESPSTKRYIPWKLFYYEAFSDKDMATTRESNLKNNGNPMRELKKRIGISNVEGLPLTTSIFSQRILRSKNLKKFFVPKIQERKYRSGKGFTLMEMMIYIALFGILMSGGVIGAYNLLEGGGRTISAEGTQQEGTFLNRKISWALSGATAASVSGGGTILTITRPDLGAQSPLVISGVDPAITLSRGTGSALQLNSDRFPVHAVIFTYQASVGGKPPMVSVNFLVQDKPFTFKYYLRQ